MSQNEDQRGGTAVVGTKGVPGTAALEERLAAAVQELEQKNRLLLVQSRQAVMGETISNVAHHWRQPLNLLGLLAQEVQMILRSPQQNLPLAEKKLEKMMETLERMSHTIDEFRLFFSPASKKVNFSIRDVVQKTVSLLDRAFASFDIDTRLEVRDDPQVCGYPNDFSQVILNILINAKDAFLARNMPKPRIIVVRVEQAGGRGVVIIADNAGGIPEQSIGKVFEPYFTTKGPAQGVGIGLYMAKTIIEKNMGGALTVRNVAGGAEFRIEV